MTFITLVRSRISCHMSSREYFSSHHSTEKTRRREGGGGGGGEVLKVKEGGYYKI